MALKRFSCVLNVRNLMSVLPRLKSHQGRNSDIVAFDFKREKNIQRILPVEKEKPSKHWNNDAAKNNYLKSVEKRKQEFLSTEKFDFDDSEEEDYDHTLWNTHKTYDEHQKEVQRRANKIAIKMTERRYFKPPKEINILTYSAKQNLRYLHFEDPEEWTVEQLAEKYPLSSDGIKRMLRNNFTLSDPKKIAKHDVKVRQRWKEMKLDKEFVRKLESLGEENLKIMSEERNDVQKKPKYGIFTYLLKKREYEIQQTKAADRIEATSTHSCQQLEDETDSFMSYDAKSKTLLTAEEFEKEFNVRNQDDSNDMQFSATENSESNNAEVKHPTDHVKIKKYKDNCQFPGIELKWDSSKGSLKKEAYVYSPELGYQKPLGNAERLEENIEIDGNTDLDVELIQVGDCFYDKNGEFLYRVPGLKKLN